MEILYTIIGIIVFILYFTDRKQESSNKSEDNYIYFKQSFETEKPQSKSYIYITPEGKRDYLNSDKWKITKRTILFRDKYTCQSCKDIGIPLEVHHITYEDFGQEKPEQLVSLCRFCHQSIHDRLGYDHNNTFPITKD